LYFRIFQKCKRKRKQFSHKDSSQGQIRQTGYPEWTTLNRGHLRTETMQGGHPEEESAFTEALWIQNVNPDALLTCQRPWV
jgi:hypothetical protein